MAHVGPLVEGNANALEDWPLGVWNAGWIWSHESLCEEQHSWGSLILKGEDQTWSWSIVVIPVLKFLNHDHLWGDMAIMGMFETSFGRLTGVKSSTLNWAIVMMASQPTPPNVPLIRPYYRLVSHWFPLIIRPYIWGGYVRGGSFTSHTQQHCTKNVQHAAASFT